MNERAAAYTEAGVNIKAASDLISRIKPLAAATFCKGVLTEIGGFGGLFKPDLGNFDEPVLVSSTDGVGTKLKLAFDHDGHSTIGIDLVGMSVNDILVQGAKPLFFLDYFATGKLDVDIAERVVAGVAEGCKQAGCALLGGETAEMPDFYPHGEYDLAGFCVGLVDNAKIVDGSSIGVGDVIIGLPSSGPHSNGYSLIRKLLAKAGAGPDYQLPGAAQPLIQSLMTPTRIYVKIVLNLMRDFEIRGMAHITGGGFYENVPRILPRGVRAEIDFNAWEKSALFEWLKQTGNLTWPEMLQIFNCGLGYLLVVDRDQKDDVMQRLQSGLHEDARVIGEIKKREHPGDECVEIIF